MRSLGSFAPLERRGRVTGRVWGLGIAPGHRPHIFDRLYQAHAGSHRSGMGLGLYVGRQIAELHGGTLEAEFPLGGGSRFVLTFPDGLGEPEAVDDLPRGEAVPAG